MADMESWKKRREEQMLGEGEKWSISNRDAIVGSFDKHNAWADYDEYLFKDINTNGCIALDFACGPGRNMVKFKDKFNRIDGTDIGAKNLEKARVWLKHNDVIDYNLYKASGSDINTIDDEQYDNVFSTIAFQHIPVYEIRYNYLKEFFRVLRSGGYVCIQQGYGGSPHAFSAYHDNGYDKQHDVSVGSPDQLEEDLTEIGFIDFKHWIRPTGPGDHHRNWIFWQAKKP